jgi:hypothetical protein
MAMVGTSIAARRFVAARLIASRLLSLTSSASERSASARSVPRSSARARNPYVLAHEGSGVSSAIRRNAEAAG